MHYNEVLLENTIKKSEKKPVIVLDECSPLKAFTIFAEKHDMDGKIYAQEILEEHEVFEAMARITPGGTVLMTVKKVGDVWKYEFKDVLQHISWDEQMLLTDTEEVEETDELEDTRTVKDEESGDECCHNCSTPLGRGGSEYFTPSKKVDITDVYAGLEWDDEQHEMVFQLQVSMKCLECKSLNVYETHYITE